MKKYFAILLFFAVSCAPKYIEKSLWQIPSVSVDARSLEYDMIRLYNSKTKMVFSISNDSTNLYLCFATKDADIQRQIILAGMEVWIDTTKKSKHQIGIKYPLQNGQTMPPPPKPNSYGQKPDSLMFRQYFLLTQKIMDIKGFQNITNGLSPLETKQGLKIKIGWDSDQTLVYEIQIPLEKWYKNITQVDSAKIFTLSVNINAVQIPNMNGSPMDPGGGGFQNPPPGNMGSGGPGGGGPGGGSPPPMNGPPKGMAAMSESRSFETNFKLNIDAK